MRAAHGEKQRSGRVGSGCCPAAHAAQAEVLEVPPRPAAPTAAKVPAGQEVQADAPGDAWEVPEGHAVHAVEADDAEIVPVGQRVHPGAPAALYDPGAHAVQAVDAVALDAAEYVPARQLAHEEDPTAGVYSPAEQFAHTVAPRPL